jgi:hypothetical protein
MARVPIYNAAKRLLATCRFGQQVIVPRHGVLELQRIAGC